MIEVKNLVKKYGNHTAVDHLNFTIEEGHVYGFLGPNGAGKSTTMNIMTGYLGATEGEVLINGHDILKEPEEAKKQIGYLPELPPLYMEMTVHEYLEFVAELKGIAKNKREESINEVEKMVKIWEVENRLIRNLSKGYRQRVGLAQAVLGFPKIIILDEPSVGLDPKQIIEIRELIRKLAKKHTVILSSHILAEVREVCDYIMIISGGKLVASDTTENLENMMSGKGQIEVEAKASRDEMDHIIRRTGKIKEVKYRTSASGITTAQIIAKGGEDIREELFLAFSHADVPMLTLNQSKTTLEEIFLELTQGSGNRMIRRRSKMRAIYKRELRSYFHSMIGYVFIAFLVAYTGIYFLAYNLNYGYPYFSYVLSGILFVYLVAIPILTMRCFAEDKKNKTDQMLLTAPVSLFEIVLGKYLAMVTVIGIPNVIFCAFPLIIKAQGTAYLKVDYISIGVFFLLGCVYAAIGMFLSALTESQMIAFISTFGILLILYLWNGILSMLPSSAVSGLVGVLIILTLIVVYIYQMTGNIVIAGVIEAVGVIAGVVVYFVKSSLYENLLTKMLGRLALADVFTDITSNSIVDITGIALYLSLIVVFVFLTVQAIQKRRWN